MPVDMSKPVKEKPPLIEVEVVRGRLAGASSYDAELIEQLKDGKLFRLDPARSRSLPQLRAYWKGLGLLVEATGWTGSVEDFHAELKMRLGMYIEVHSPFTGEVKKIPDSIAINSMLQDEMNAFFERARMAVIEVFGYNPWDFLDKPRREVPF